MALIGGQHTTSTAATKLADDDTPCSQIVLRLNTSGTTLYWGGSTVASTPANAYGFVKAEESYTIGPFDRGPVRPSEIFIASGAGSEIVFWFGKEF